MPSAWPFFFRLDIFHLFPFMADHPELWECPACAAALDISGIGFYTRVTCPQCGREEYVHTMLANFRIDGVLGVGGMSVVLRARDLVLGRPVAIKVLNDTYRDQPERIARFERECELMAKVRHGNVVSVYSAGWARGQFYIAMELITGKNLEIEVATGGLDPAYALEVTRQVAHGLNAAHRSGLLHRDMKPGNILLDANGQAKVLDFGLSLGTTDADTEEIIWATPYYVPPETLMREAEDVRTDIYALGMTLRHLLTGNDKFPTEPQSARELIECKQHLAPLRHDMPQLERSYCELVDHMTRFNPAARPRNYKELLTDIEEVQASLSEKAAGFSSPKRRRRMFMAATMVASTLVLGVVAAAGTATVLHLTQGPGELVVGKKFDWDDRAALHAAEKAMASGKFDRAISLYRKVARKQGEASIATWAALHAYMLKLLEDKLNPSSPERDKFRSRFTSLLQCQPSSAGLDMMQSMRDLQEADTEDVDIKNPVLRAAQACFELEEGLALGFDSDIPRLKRQAVKQLRAAGKPYEALASELEKL